jgi:hypothetical protein
MKAKSPTLPPFPAKTGPGRKRSPGPVPAWGLKLGGLLTTLAVFGGSFGVASSNPYVTNAPLQPATVAAVATAAPSTATTSTTTLRSTVRTTTRTAVTTTKSS